MLLMIDCYNHVPVNLYQCKTATVWPVKHCLRILNHFSSGMLSAHSTRVSELLKWPVPSLLFSFWKYLQNPPFWLHCTSPGRSVDCLKNKEMLLNWQKLFAGWLAFPTCTLVLYFWGCHMLSKEGGWWPSNFSRGLRIFGFSQNPPKVQWLFAKNKPRV